MVGAVITGTLVFGAVLLSLQESHAGSLLLPTARSTLPAPNLTPLPGSEPITITAEAQITLTTAAAPTACPPPQGWQPFVVGPGDSLQTLAESRGSSLEQIKAGNCLMGEMLLPNVIIYLPPLIPVPVGTENLSATALPAATGTSLACQQPAGWNVYIVQSGNTLTRIAISYRISVTYLKQVNCLTGDIILPGMRIWVPNVPTSTFTATATATRRPSETPIPPPILTATPTQTATYTLTSTPIPTATDTPTLTPTPTDTPTATYTFPPTPIPTDTETPTPTLIPN